MAHKPIVDQYGYPLTSGFGGGRRLLDAAQNNGERPDWPVSLDSINRVIPAWDWRMTVSVSRRLFANMGIPRGAIIQRAMFAVGRAWAPKFEGADKAWGKLAEEWLREEWYAVCNVRGSMHDLVTDLYLASVGIDRDGDFGVLLTESDEGYPMLQFIPAHRIGQRQVGLAGARVGATDAVTYLPRGESGKRREVSGFYEGLLIENGVIYNEVGRPVAYRILGTLPGEDVDVSERDFIHVFDPEYMEQGRGLPAFSHACNELRDALQSHQWEQHAQLIASSLGIQEVNDSGAADTEDLSTERNAENELVITRQELLRGGKMSYFRAGSGGEIKQFTSTRPSTQWNEFWDRMVRSSLAGIPWPYSLAWKPADANAANLRGELLKAQSAVDDRQDLLEYPARRMLGYGVSKAIELGILPEYPGPDRGGFLKWGFSMPPKMSVDRGRDAANRRNDYMLGLRNLQEILAEDGITLEAQRDQREAEVRDTIRRAKRISDEEKVPLGTAMSLFEQRTATGAVPGGLFGAVFDGEDTTALPPADAPPDTQPEEDPAE